MPVPSSITELSTTPGSNYPTGTEAPSSLDDYLRAHASFLAQLNIDRTPSGVVQHFAGTAAPAGWLACTGQAVSRATYAALFAAIGTTWGVGDGATTFNLPPADRMLIGAGGLYAAGSTGGSRDAIVVAHTHTASTGNQSTNHTHTFSASTSSVGDHQHGVAGGTFGAGGGGAYMAGSGGAVLSGAAGAHSHTVSGTTATNGASHNHSVTVASTGATGTNANLPPYAAMLLIIKV